MHRPHYIEWCSAVANGRIPEIESCRWVDDNSKDPAHIALLHAQATANKTLARCSLYLGAGVHSPTANSSNLRLKRVFCTCRCDIPLSGGGPKNQSSILDYFVFADGMLDPPNALLRLGLASMRVVQCHALSGVHTLTSWHWKCRYNTLKAAWCIRLTLPNHELCHPYDHAE
jgi:hypothetical protein